MAEPIRIGVTFRWWKAVGLYRIARYKQTAGIAGHHNASSLVQQGLHRITRSIYILQEWISEDHGCMFVDPIFDLGQGVALSLHPVAGLAQQLKCGFCTVRRGRIAGRRLVFIVIARGEQRQH